MAWLVILMRCFHSLAELWGGRGNAIMWEETELITLDSE